MRVALTQLNLSAGISKTLGGVRKLLLSLMAVCALAGAGSLTLASPARSLTVAVIGDSVAHDLGRGMEELFADNNRVRVIRKTKFATGLVRTDYYDWNAQVRDFLRRHNPDVIVVIMGGNDRQAVRIKGRRLSPLSKGWQADYERRVARFMNTIKREHARVYWVSLPPVRSNSLNRAYKVMNRIYRREAARHKFQYVDVWSKFTTSSGAYSSFGRSLEGVRRQLRMDDGQHFTPAGREVFAAIVAKQIGLH